MGLNHLKNGIGAGLPGKALYIDSSSLDQHGAERSIAREALHGVGDGSAVSRINQERCVAGHLW